jgi:hypothetical protein
MVKLSRTSCGRSLAGFFAGLPAASDFAAAADACVGALDAFFAVATPFADAGLLADALLPAVALFATFLLVGTGFGAAAAACFALAGAAGELFVSDSIEGLVAVVVLVDRGAAEEASFMAGFFSNTV